MSSPDTSAPRAPSSTTLVVGSLGVIAALFSLGVWIGRTRSPNWAERQTVEQYVVRNAKGAVDGGVVRAELRCDSHVYRYEEGAPRVASPLVPDAAVVLGQPIAGRGLDAEQLKTLPQLTVGTPVALAVGGPDVVAKLRLVGQSGKNAQLRAAAVGLVAATGTAYLGYRLSYSDRLECSHPMVERVLADTAVWREAAAKIRREGGR